MITKVDLITGFLGSGKTTFIARYGDWLGRQGTHFAVIENEFGASGVDRAVLGESFHDVGELSGGCICCTLKTGFYAMLANLAGQYDRIIVEPSGLFDMDDFFEILSTLEREGLYQAGMCLTLIDPHILPCLQERERQVLWAELTGTGAVLWTQADVPPEADLTAAAQTVSDILDLDTPLTFYAKPSHALTDDDFAALQNCEPVFRKHHRCLLNHNQIFQSASLRPKGVFEQQSLLETLDRMIDSGDYGEILRVKGFVHAACGSLSVNCTVSGRTVIPCPEKTAMLNFIGRQVDRAKIKTTLENAVSAALS